uniref:Protein kinase domain-containing protein n=1 Tax=Globodera pallida TaxID=36090 RepID=A0A183BK87_GLOPA
MHFLGAETSGAERAGSNDGAETSRSPRQDQPRRNGKQCRNSGAERVHLPEKLFTRLREAYGVALEERDEILREVITGTLFQQRKTNDRRLLVLEVDIWRVFTQIADAVQYIHTKRIIHRDLKPPNVLLTIEDTVKLTDFGLSRQHNAESRVQTICPLLNKLPSVTTIEPPPSSHNSSKSAAQYRQSRRLTEIDMDSVLYASVLNEGVKYLVLVLEYVNGGDLETWLKVCCSTILEEKYGGDTPAGDISAELELFVDDDVSSADVAAVQPTALEWVILSRNCNWPPSTRQQQLHKRLSSVDLPFPPPSPQFHRFHPQLQSPVSASPPQQQQHYQRLPFLANHHNQQKQQQQVITETSSGGVVGQQDNSSSGANATSSLMDWSLCNSAGSVGGLPLPPVLCPTAVAADVHYHQQQQNHQRKFLTTNNNSNGGGGNINNYCYSSSESGIVDSINGTATSPRPAVQQQQLVRQRMCGGGSGPNALVDTPTDNVADLYTSIHKGDHHRFPRHAMPTTVSSVTTSTNSVTTATQPSTVQCVRQQQLQPNVVELFSSISTNRPQSFFDLAVAKLCPAIVLTITQYPKQQQQQQQSGVSPPPYTALYGTKMVAAAGQSPPITTAALHEGPSKSAAISPLTTAICVLYSLSIGHLAIDELLGKLSTVTGGGGGGDH